jgi:hypothetical protein
MMTWILLMSVRISLAETVTTRSLLREMVDLHRLAELHEPAYKTIQFSSFDRRSTLPSRPGWFANSDGFGKEPIPGFEKVLQPPGEDGVGRYLICDVEGPGAIVRLWTARIVGTVQVYLDGSKEPLYDGEAEAFFKKAYEAMGHSDEGMVAAFSQASAGYYPIPFSKRCRIEWTGDLNELHFYQVQIRRYGSGAKVQTFRRDDLAKHATLIKNVARVLKSPGTAWAHQSKQQPLEIVSTIAGGESKDILEIKGEKAIERLTLEVRARNVDKALRQSIMKIAFDGAPHGQVQAPIGDFFGAAPGINPYDSLPFTVQPDGTMVCRFLMPFEAGARLSIENRGEQTVTVTGSALPVAYKWKEGSSLHFRARWRVDHDLHASDSIVQDIPYVLARGKGNFVGATALIMNPTSVPSSWGNWWGEGDEKIFVDDDVRPSTFGTGSEDYFNYAWSSSRIFTHAYCGQPRNDGPANRGFVTNYRWQILDDMPFKERFDFFMELFSHEPVPGFSYARIAYYYGAPEISDDHMLVSDADVRHLSLPKGWLPIGRKLTEKATFYQAEELAAGDAPFDLDNGDLWSGGRLMVWMPRQSGDTLELQLPVSEKGRYIIVLTAARCPEAGSFRAKLGEIPLVFNQDLDVVKLAVPHRTLSRNFKSQEMELERGTHILSLENAGKGDERIGIDFVWILPGR